MPQSLCGAIDRYCPAKFGQQDGMRATSPCSLGYIVCGGRGAGAAAVRTCWRVFASWEAASAAQPLGARAAHVGHGLGGGGADATGWRRAPCCQSHPKSVQVSPSQSK